MFKSPETASVFIQHHSPEDIGEDCTQCGACVSQCRFLSKYGNPGQLATQYAHDPDTCRDLAFECSLCGLCTALCPRDLNIPDMILNWRQEAIAENKVDLAPYRRILGYEKTGCSKLFSFYSLPEGCDTIFFPGCTLTGTRPKTTMAAHQYLNNKIPNSGIVLDCCTKPSHDLGRQIFFEDMFSEMADYLEAQGISTIITACPSCQKIFETSRRFMVKSIYQIMAQDPDCRRELTLPEAFAVVQDPCQARNDSASQAAVRDLARHLGITPIDSRKSRAKTLCCGEGASAGCRNPDMANTWTQQRQKAADGQDTITYCAGCASRLNGEGNTIHILDLFFDRENTLTEKLDVSSGPVTYINRLKVKRMLKKLPGPRITRVRTYFHGKFPLKMVLTAAVSVILVVLATLI